MNKLIRRTVDNRVVFGEGNSVDITTHFLTQYPMSLRIEECVLSITNNVEIKLVMGDDVVIKKQTIKKSFLENPEPQRLKEEVNQMCIAAKEYLSNSNKITQAV